MKRNFFYKIEIRQIIIIIISFQLSQMSPRKVPHGYRYPFRKR